MPGDRVALSSVAYPEQSDADDKVPGTGGPTSTADYCEPIEAMVSLSRDNRAAKWLSGRKHA